MAHVCDSDPVLHLPWQEHVVYHIVQEETDQRHIVKYRVLSEIEFRVVHDDAGTETTVSTMDIETPSSQESSYLFEHH